MGFINQLTSLGGPTLQAPFGAHQGSTGERQSDPGRLERRCSGPGHRGSPRVARTKSAGSVEEHQP